MSKANKFFQVACSLGPLSIQALCIRPPLTTPPSQRNRKGCVGGGGGGGGAVEAESGGHRVSEAHCQMQLVAAANICHKNKSELQLAPNVLQASVAQLFHSFWCNLRLVASIAATATATATATSLTGDAFVICGHQLRQRRLKMHA